jgi:multiple sugar transport system substrate-binding protein
MRTFAARAVQLGATLAASAILLAGCSGTDAPAGSTPTSVSQAAIKKAMSTKTTITFWSWVPKISDEVALFEKAYPDITVKVVNAGQGADYYTKLQSAIDAGSGAPDVAQIEYPHMAALELKKSLLDLAPYGANTLKADYVPYAWEMVSSGSSVYGIPQDSGPLGLLYRADLLAKDRLTAPTTWLDFANVAAAMHKKEPSRYLTNLSPSNGSAFIGLLQQNGVNPFSYDGKKTVHIDFTSAAAKQVVDYWGKLVSSGAVSTDADFTDGWYHGLASGKYASWVSAAWGPVFLQGTAANTSGKWRAAELPQWSAGAHQSGNVGGSTDAVLASTKNKIAAAIFAQWLNHDKQSTLNLATQQFLFPTTTATLQNTAFSGQESKFYGGQQVNQIFGSISSNLTAKSGAVPFIDFVYSSFNDTLGKAYANGGSGVDAALSAWQSKIVSYAKSQGFTVTTN